jgi:hypothetical protein
MQWLGKLLGFGLWAITKWGAIALIAEGTWTFFRSLSEEMTVTQAMVWGFAAMGALLLLLVGVAKAFDYVAGLLPEVLARQRAGKFFRDMALHGKHKAITINEAVHYWNGKDPETPTEWVKADFKLHHLKAAIGQGLLKAQGPGGLVTANTLCRPADLADFFGSRRWIWVKDDQWKSATYAGDSQ